MLSVDPVSEQVAELLAACACPRKKDESMVKPCCEGEGFLDVDSSTSFLYLKLDGVVLWCSRLVRYGFGRYCTCPNRVLLFRKYGI